ARSLARGSSRAGEIGVQPSSATPGYRPWRLDRHSRPLLRKRRRAPRHRALQRLVLRHVDHPQDRPGRLRDVLCRRAVIDRMNDSLIELLAAPRETRGSRIYGVVVAVVTNNQDPDGQGRVRVRYPWLAAENEGESWWARIVVPMAGKEMGTYFLPEVDDSV